MHKTSMENMRRFVENHLSKRKNDKLIILDLGSQNINGTYKQFFKNENWKYLGVDIENGDNVDVVIHDIYNWKEFKDNSIDIVISGQTFEHIEYIWQTIAEIGRIMKPGGIGCLIAPSSGPEHRYPVDCWRIYPDGFRALAKYAGLEVIDVYVTSDKIALTVDKKNIWKDTVLIFKKK